MAGDYHIPVLLNESLEGLRIDPAGIYADVTFGGGGHARAILERLTTGRLIAFDQDPDAWAQAPDDPRLTLVRSNFRDLSAELAKAGIRKLNGLIADLGISSHQVDTPDRGFSFRLGGSPDMRMGRDMRMTAIDIINTYKTEDLKRIFKEYGEIRQAGKLATAIDSYRTKEKIVSVRQLLDILNPFAPRGAEHKFYAQAFQALRIEVNDEMQALKALLEQAAGAIAPGGRLAVISYHSLEDRMVKHFIRAGNVEGEVHTDLFGHAHNPFRAVHKKPIAPGEREIARNPRARSARLRIAERTES